MANQRLGEMPQRLLLVWIALIIGYFYLRRFAKALASFQTMRKQDFKQDEQTLVSTRLLFIDQAN